MANEFSLKAQDITVRSLLRNAPPALLYEQALRNESGTLIASSGALVAYSGEKTGRSPNDKRIVEEPGSKDDIWWGKVNIALDNYSGEPALAAGMSAVVDVDTGNKRSLPMIGSL